MGILETAISNAVQAGIAAALTSLQQQLGASLLTEADRLTLDKARALIVEAETLAGGEVTPAAGGDGGGVTVPDIVS
jgi:hypothetical protein